MVITDASQVDELIFDPTCVQNPASFIALEEKKPVPRGAEPDTRKIAVMVKGCDSRAIVAAASREGVRTGRRYRAGHPLPRRHRPAQGG